jgi:hypothetical protein
MSSKIGYAAPVEEFNGGGGGGSAGLDWPADFYEEKYTYDPPPVELDSNTPVVPLEQVRTLGAETHGTIVNIKTGEPLRGVAVSLYDEVQKKFISQRSIVDSPYIIRTTYDPSTVVVYFDKNGYKTGMFYFSDLVDSPDIGLEPKSNTVMILGGAALAFYLFASKKKKEVGKITTADVMPFMLIGGGVLAFSFIEKILQALGLWKDQDEKELDDTAVNPDSWWSPNFWRSKPANEQWTFAIDTQTAIDWAADIWDSFGPFNDCEECAITVFKRCRTQSNASFLSDIFQQRYGQDLLTFLRGGWWPQDRLSDTDVNVINQYVNKLPKY